MRLLVRLALLSAAVARTSPAAQDPLITLMLSQPKIDITSPAGATAAFDPPAVRPGEQAVYRVTFNALEESVSWPAEPPAAPGLEMRAGAHGQILQMTGPAMQPRTTFNYHVQPSKPGEFVVPEFTVKVYGRDVRVPAARLEVTATPPAAAAPAQRLLLEFTRTNLYAGQPARVRVLFPGSSGGSVQGLAQVQLTGDGFIVDQSAVQQRITAVSRAGANVPTYIYETTLTPLTAGRLSILAQGFSAGLHVSGPLIITAGAIIPGGLPQYTLLDSDPVELEVKPLPRTGELPGFTGAIGTFAVDAPALATNTIQLGDPVKLTVTVRGDNGFVHLVAPPPPQTREWQVFAPTADSATAPGAPTSGFPTPWRGAPGAHLPVCAAFTYTLIPLTAEARATPAIPFSYFDPDRGVYVDLTIPPASITVKGGAASADAQALLQSQSSEAENEKEPVLSDLALSPGLAAGSLVPVQQRVWFFLVQLAFGGAFLGLWIWDRRRRYLEQHPDVVLRRRARRALRAEWRALRRAAQAGDAPRFAARAVGAMRIACAPHYPAEPRALVGADVLAVLPETDRAGRVGEVVRRFFAVTDEARFATAPAEAGDLLGLRPEVESVLQKLEERLQT
jgi:hypothetical protein